VLGRVGGLLRRLGLGRLVDRAGGLVARLAGRERTVDGLTLSVGHVGHLHYVAELVDGTRERLLLEELVRACRPGTMVLEAGAHIGFLTMQAARAVGPDGIVVTFEANPRTVPVLERNLRRNGLADRVEVVPVALGAEPGRSRFVVRGGGDESSFYGDGAAIEVDVTTVDAWLGSHPVERRPVSVVKVDVEGAEPAVLAGMRGTLEAAGADLTLFVECNPGALEAAGSSAAELVGLLRSFGFGVSWLDEAERRVAPYEEQAWSGEYANLVCRRSL
jgi:FkbM family methyltransferase